MISISGRGALCCHSCNVIYVNEICVFYSKSLNYSSFELLFKYTNLRVVERERERQENTEIGVREASREDGE